MFTPTQHEGPPPLTPFRSLSVNFRPERHKIIDGRHDRHTDHKPNREMSDQIYRKDERSRAYLPSQPAMVQNRRHYTYDLHHHFQLSQIAGLDGKSFRRGNTPEPADEELAADNNYRHPRGHDARIELNQCNKS